MASRMATKGDTLADRLAAGTEWQGECLVWTRARDDNGYGMMTYRNVNYRAHVAAWLVAGNAKPGKGEPLDHTCFNRACANIAHLRLATYKQNNEHLRGAQSNSKTGYRGVTYTRGRFRATVVHNKKQYWCGYHDTAEDAAAAAQAKRAELFTHDDGGLVN